MCIRDRAQEVLDLIDRDGVAHAHVDAAPLFERAAAVNTDPVSYTHLRAHETVLDLVCRLLLEKKKTTYIDYIMIITDIEDRKKI